MLTPFSATISPCAFTQLGLGFMGFLLPIPPCVYEQKGGCEIDINPSRKRRENGMDGTCTVPKPFELGNRSRARATPDLGYSQEGGKKRGR